MSFVPKLAGGLIAPLPQALGLFDKKKKDRPSMVTSEDPGQSLINRRPHIY